MIYRLMNYNGCGSYIHHGARIFVGSVGLVRVLIIVIPAVWTVVYNDRVLSKLGAKLKDIQFYGSRVATVLVAGFMFSGPIIIISNCIAEVLAIKQLFPMPLELQSGLNIPL